ncbi:MAG: hypothetical protein ACOYON_11265 [Fimbriimonas sp.]
MAKPEPREFKGISDNPFRILGIGSRASLMDLERAVALAQEQGLLEATHAREFGSSSISELVEAIASMRRDPSKWIAYCLYWPAARGSDILAKTCDAEYVVPSRCYTVSERSVGGVLAQMRFLKYWKSFTQNPTHSALRGAMSCWNTVQCDKGLRSELCEHIAMQVCLDQAEVESRITEGIGTATKSILDFAINIAFTFYQQDDIENCAAILSALDMCPQQNELEELGYGPFGLLGDRLAQEVADDKSALCYSDSHRAVLVPIAFFQLSELCELMDGLHPKQMAWNGVLRDKQALFREDAGRVLKSAVDLWNLRDFTFARHRMNAILASCAVHPAVKVSARSYLAEMEVQERKESLPPEWAESHEGKDFEYILGRVWRNIVRKVSRQKDS